MENQEEPIQMHEDMPFEMMKGKGVGKHPNSLANLRKFTKEGARIGQRKGLEKKLLTKELKEQFKLNATTYQELMKDMPELSAIDVMKMTVHMCLQREDFEGAARWAEKLAEYERPKLQRVETIHRNEAEDMTDDELMRFAKEQGISINGPLYQ